MTMIADCLDSCCANMSSCDSSLVFTFARLCLMVFLLNLLPGGVKLYGRQSLFRQSQSTTGRVGSVNDFLAGRVNRSSSDVLQLLEQKFTKTQRPDAIIVPMTSGVVGQKSRRRVLYVPADNVNF